MPMSASRARSRFLTTATSREATQPQPWRSEIDRRGAAVVWSRAEIEYPVYTICRAVDCILAVLRKPKWVYWGRVTFKSATAAARDLEAASVTKNRRSSVEIIKPRLILYI